MRGGMRNPEGLNPEDKVCLDGYTTRAISPKINKHYRYIPTTEGRRIIEIAKRYCEADIPYTRFVSDIEGWLTREE